MNDDEKLKEIKIINDSLEAFDDLKALISNTFKRSLDNKQIQMICTNAVISTYPYWNDLFAYKFSSDETFAETLHSISLKIINILNLVPFESDFNELKMRLQSIYNYCLIGIGFQQGDHGVFKTQSTANILMTILSGLSNLHNVEIPKSTSNNYYHELNLQISYYLSTAAMLTTVLYYIPAIDYNNTISWISKSLSYYLKLSEITSTANYEVILKRIDDINRFYFGINIMHQWHLHAIRGGMIFQMVLGKDWLSLVKQFDIHLFDTYNRLIEPVRSNPIMDILIFIQEDRTRILKKLDNLYRLKLININFPPENSHPIIYIRNYLRFDEIRLERYELFSNICNTYRNVKLENSNNQMISVIRNNSKQIIKLIDNTIEIKTEIEKIKTTGESVFKPEDLEYYIWNFEDLIVLKACFAIFQSNPVGFFDETTKLHKSLAIIEIDKYPEIESLIIQAGLWVMSILDDWEILPQILEKIKTLIPRLQYNFIELFNLLIIEFLIKLQLQMFTKDEFNHELDSLDIICSSSGYNHIYEIFQNYKLYLSDIFLLNTEQIQIEVPINFTDIRSWLIPVFKVNKRPVLLNAFNIKSYKTIL
jgi:hypothetical protein